MKKSNKQSGNITKIIIPNKLNAILDYILKKRPMLSKFELVKDLLEIGIDELYPDIIEEFDNIHEKE